MPKRFQRSSQGSITGCIVFLQALYLSNLEFGCEYLRYDASPPIAAFNDKHVNMMISADLVTRTNPGYPFPKYGKLKLRDTPSFVSPDDRSVRTQSVILGSPSTQSGMTGSPSMDFVYEYLMSRYKSKKLSAVVGPEAVSSINNMVDMANNKFYSIIDDIHDFINAFDNPANVQAANPLSEGSKNISNIGPRSSEISEGSGYPRRQSDGSNKDTTPLVQRPVRAALSTAIEPPSFDLAISQELETPNNSVTHPDDSSNKRTLSVSPATVTCMTKQCTILMLQECGDEDRKRRKYTIKNPPSHMLKEKTKRIIRPSKNLLSPFISKIYQLERHDATVADELYSYIMSIPDTPSLDEIWIQRSHPFKISITLHNLQETLKIGGQMDSDCLNLGIRILYHIEMEKFKNTKFMGWRHFVNQDFGMYAVASGEFWNPEHQLAHFKGDELIYDVSECHMILLPVHFFNHYVLYAFDMEHKKLSILDSLGGEGPLSETRSTKHEKLRVSISECLTECLAFAFPGWHEDISSWEYELVENIPEQTNGDDCGFFAFNYMWNWNGRQLINPISEDTAELRKQYMLHLLNFKANEASLPGYVRHLLSRIRK